jgi:AraC-like DNA-binding protein
MEDNNNKCIMGDYKFPIKTIQENFTRLLNKLATNEGFTKSALINVDFYRSTSCQPSAFHIFEPSILIVAQGAKKAHYDKLTYNYNPDNYFVVTTCLPLECSVVEASQEIPFLGLRLKIDRAILCELILNLNEHGITLTKNDKHTFCSKINGNLLEASLKLLHTLDGKDDSKILGPEVTKEIYYHILRGESGGALLNTIILPNKFNKISKILKMIHTNFEQTWALDSMAEYCHMSVSCLHDHFKSVTKMSPLQYLKMIRLTSARRLLINTGINTNEVALKVGYVSASQFSREFKRHFGYTPSEGRIGTNIHNVSVPDSCRQLL